MRILVGYSGVIGSTLLDKMKFDYEFNSKNIDKFDSVPDGCDLYLSCLPAAKWLVNKDPAADATNIENIVKILSKKTYGKIVLFSTIDVYCESPLRVSESFKPVVKSMNYGTNRYLFEVLVSSFLTYTDLKIFRLPAIYGKHIKKNILFDLIHNNNVDKINVNSKYQWYNLDNLVNDVEEYSKNFPKVNTFNLFPEPIPTRKIIKLFPEYNLSNFGPPIEYNYGTNIFGKKYNYIQTAKYSLMDIEKFVNACRK